MSALGIGGYDAYKLNSLKSDAEVEADEEVGEWGLLLGETASEAVSVRVVLLVVEVIGLVLLLLPVEAALCEEWVEPVKEPLPLDEGALSSVGLLGLDSLSLSMATWASSIISSDMGIATVSVLGDRRGFFDVAM